MRRVALLPMSLLTPDGNLEQAKAGEKSPLRFPGMNRSSDSAGVIQAVFGARLTTEHPRCASSIPIPSCQQMRVQLAPSCKNVPFCSPSPLQRRKACKGGSYVSPINVIKRIKLLERVSFSFSFYLIREIPTAPSVQMKPRLLSVVRQPREDTLPFNLAH